MKRETRTEHPHWWRKFQEKDKGEITALLYAVQSSGKGAAKRACKGRPYTKINLHIIKYEG